SDVQEVATWLGTVLPQYKTTVRAMGKVIVVGTGMATGIGIVPKGANKATLNWQFPNLVVQTLIMLSIILTGILPGAIVLLIVWFSVKGQVNKIEQDIIAALTSGAGPGQQPNA